MNLNYLVFVVVSFYELFLDTFITHPRVPYTFIAQPISLSIGFFKEPCLRILILEDQIDYVDQSYQAA